MNEILEEIAFVKVSRDSMSLSDATPSERCISKWLPARNQLAIFLEAVEDEDLRREGVPRRDLKL